VRIFKNTRFSRFAKKEHIDDEELLKVVGKLEEGHFYADLGGDVYKMCIARSGEGKSGGYRVMVLFRSGERTFYVHGFVKSVTTNISKKELAQLKKLAKTLFAYTDTEIEMALKEGYFEEIKEKV